MANKNKTKLIVIIISLLALVVVCVAVTLHIASGRSSGTDSGVDTDLSTMSATAIYSEVSNMMNKPEKYDGKHIKVKGYYVVSIDDATECCQQGLLFKLKKGERDKLPKEEHRFVISGKFVRKKAPGTDDPNAYTVMLEDAKIYKK